MERQHLRLIPAVVALLATLFLMTACGASNRTAAQDDTDTVDPEDIIPEGDIVGSGYW